MAVMLRAMPIATGVTFWARALVVLARSMAIRAGLSVVNDSGSPTGSLSGRFAHLLFDSVDAHGATLLAVTHDHELLPHFDRVVDFGDFRRAP